MSQYFRNMEYQSQSQATAQTQRDQIGNIYEYYEQLKLQLSPNLPSQAQNLIEMLLQQVYRQQRMIIKLEKSEQGKVSKSSFEELKKQHSNLWQNYIKRQEELQTQNKNIFNLHLQEAIYAKKLYKKQHKLQKKILQDENEKLKAKIEMQEKTEAKLTQYIDKLQRKLKAAETRLESQERENLRKATSQGKLKQLGTHRKKTKKS